MDPRFEILRNREQLGEGYADPEDSANVIFVAEDGIVETATVQWKSASGSTAGYISAYYDDATNLALISLNGHAVNTGEQGIAQIQAINSADTKAAYAQISSYGEFYINLIDAGHTDPGDQRVRIAAESNDETHKLEALVVSAFGVGTTGAGFGASIGFYAEDAGGNTAWQGEIKGVFTDASSNNSHSDMYIAAEGYIKFSQGNGGSGPPEVSSANHRSIPEEALKQLLQILEDMCLILDNSVA